MKYVVMSDLHFGDVNATLTDKQTIRWFMHEINRIKEDKILILLGDVLDLWAATEEQVFKVSRSFFNQLEQNKSIKEILYIPGNHDYMTMLDCMRNKNYNKIKNLQEPNYKWKSCVADFSPYLRGIFYKPTLLVYPEVRLKVHGKTVCFTHGHIFDYFLNPYAVHNEFARLFHFFRKEHATEKELERTNAALFQFLSLIPYMKTAKDNQIVWYRRIVKICRPIMSLLSIFKKRTRLKDFDFGEIIQTWKTDFRKAEFDYLIFAHTHHPREHDNALNVGCWIKDSTLDKDFINTYIIIDDETGEIKLCQLGGKILCQKII